MTIKKKVTVRYKVTVIRNKDQFMRNSGNCMTLFFFTLKQKRSYHLNKSGIKDQKKEGSNNLF